MAPVNEKKVFWLYFLIGVESFYATTKKHLNTRFYFK
jgi:hypothetical protein